MNQHVPVVLRQIESLAVLLAAVAQRLRIARAAFQRLALAVERFEQRIPR